MSDLELEERPAPSPGALRLLGRLAIVVGGAAVAVALLVAVVAFGPFAGIRSIFVTRDPHWGTCITFTLDDPCHGIPPSTVEAATGLALPPGAEVVDSAATDVDFTGYRNLWAVIAYPARDPSPFAGRQSVRGPALASGGGVYSTGTAALAKHGVRTFDVFASVPRLTDWWAVTGWSGDTTYVYVDVSNIAVHSAPFDR